MNELHLIDCMDYMKTCKDNQFDLAIIDPPYGIGMVQSGLHGGVRKNIYKKWKNETVTNYKLKDWDKTIPNEIYFRELKRISVNYMMFGGNYFIEHLQNKHSVIVWNKKTSGHFADGEIILDTFEHSLKIFEYLWNGFSTQKNIITKRIHPTQKPVDLYKWLLTNYAKPGDKLFDSHSGSGSFRIAAHDLGFDLVSCELDPDYYRDNEARYQKHIQQIDLFKPAELQKNIFQKELL